MEVIFDSVTKSYGLVNALKDVSFSVSPGEFVFITGPSGAGKSTIIKLILRQIRPSSGKLLINSVNINSVKQPEVESIRRQIGVIFQDYQLISDKSIEENITLAMDIAGCPRNLAAKKLDQVLSQVNLLNRRFLFPSQLSGGELQRASLARALAVSPKLILADEPTGNLDLANSWKLIKLLQEINRRYSTTIIMTTHHLDFIESLKHRVISLKNGKIVNP
ncbi:MAG: ATP-binding cassette domain-containing protein [Candidatus Shapirobacteria bacterium]